MAMLLYGGTVITPLNTVEGASLVVSDDGEIAFVGPMEEAPRVDGPRLYVRNRIIAPGFVDIHVHGGHGITFGGSPDLAEDVRAYSQWAPSTGAVGFLASIAAPDMSGYV